MGVEARLEPAEVMTSLGSTVARVVGKGSVIAPPRPRFTPPDVIVVPEPEAPPEPEAAPEAPGEAPDVSGPAVPQADVMEEVTDAATGDEGAGPSVVSEPLSHVLMRPGDVASPTWTYTAPGAGTARNDRRRIAAIVLGVVAGLLVIILGAALLGTRTVPTQVVAGSLGGYTLPGSGGQPGPVVTTNQPGTYNGTVRVSADGSIHLRASGDIHLRIDGLAHVVASGDVKVSGDGVVNNVSSAKVRVRGNGTIRITIHDGFVRLRVQGSVTAESKGTVRIGGVGRFLITHRPV